MAQYGHLTSLDVAECRLLLSTRNFGRIGWNSAAGVQILPVSYGMVGDVIVFRTAAGSPMAELVRPMEVSFQVDDLDVETSTGWCTGPPVPPSPSCRPTWRIPGPRATGRS